MSTDHPIDDPEQPDQFEDLQMEDEEKEPAARKTPPDTTEEKEPTKETAPETKEPARVEEPAADVPSAAPSEESDKPPQQALTPPKPPLKKASRNVQLLIAACAAMFLVAIGIGAHDVFESAPLPTAETKPAAEFKFTEIIEQVDIDLPEDSNSQVE